jgi:hypothetical protein
MPSHDAIENFSSPLTVEVLEEEPTIFTNLDSEERVERVEVSSADLDAP